MVETLPALVVLSLAGVFYAYVIYPILIWGASRFAVSRVPSGERQGDASPSVAMLVAANNEQRWIDERIANALALDYPAELLTVVIASDGSEDRTNEIVRDWADKDSRVKLLAYEQRRGKATTLNDAMTQISADVVAFSDANTMYEPQALRKLASWFADERVGAVCGRLVLHDPATGNNVDGLYWRYETFIKKCEAKLGGLLGANGAIYAMRRPLFVPIPDNTIIDDFMIPLLAKLRHDCQLVYDENAVAHEETPPTIGDEFRRRARIGAGGFQSLATLWPLLSPRYGWTAIAFWNHKVLRWCVPALMLVAFSANAMLLHDVRFRWLFAMQVMFYALALLGNWIRGHSLPAKLARTASLFCSMNAALAVGFWKWLFVRQRGTWRRTVR
jgi:cellulose synthase/poly-beta-1,6-N-acetylglucosamine synthase-like glycosyltransferase